MRRKKQSGVSLLESLMYLTLAAIIAVGFSSLIFKQSRSVKNQITSAKMTKVLEATKRYVSDNFPDLQEALSSKRQTNFAGGTNTYLPGRDVNGDGTIDALDTITVASLEIPIEGSGGSIPSLETEGYLNSGFTPLTSWGTTLKVFISFTGNDNFIQIMVMNPISSDLTQADQEEIAFGIKNGRGAIWYGSSSPINPCSGGSSCIKSTNDYWELKQPNVLFQGIVGSQPTNNVAAVAIYQVNIHSISDEALYKTRVINHPEANTVNSDIGFRTNDDEDKITASPGGPLHEKHRSIFFNASKHEDIDADNIKDLVGDSITYRQNYNSSGFAMDKAIISIETNESGKTAPFFSSTGGIVSSKKETVGSACNFDKDDKYSDFGVIATESTTGKLIKCTKDFAASTGSWKEFGNIDYINHVKDSTSAVPTDDYILLPAPSGTNSSTVYDLIGDLKSASAIILRGNFGVRSSVAGSWSASLDINSRLDGSINTVASVNHTSSGTIYPEVHAIVPVKDGKIVYNVATNPASVTLQAPWQVYITAYIE